MPFKSKKQMRFLFSKKPKIAKRWAKEYSTPKNLPMRVLGNTKRVKSGMGGMSGMKGM